MPNGNGTGPNGRGARTGRGFGTCPPTQGGASASNPPTGYGRGMGRGMGRGRGPGSGRDMSSRVGRGN